MKRSTVILILLTCAFAAVGCKKKGKTGESGSSGGSMAKAMDADSTGCDALQARHLKCVDQLAAAIGKKIGAEAAKAKISLLSPQYGIAHGNWVKTCKGYVAGMKPDKLKAVKRYKDCAKEKGCAALAACIAKGW